MLIYGMHFLIKQNYFYCNIFALFWSFILQQIMTESRNVLGKSERQAVIELIEA